MYEDGPPVSPHHGQTGQGVVTENRGQDGVSSHLSYMSWPECSTVAFSPTSDTIKLNMSLDSLLVGVTHILNCINSAIYYSMPSTELYPNRAGSSSVLVRDLNLFL